MNAATPKTPHQRRMRRMGNVNPHFKSFVENTSLHGIKYICDGNSHCIKRGFWCIVVIGFIISFFAIYRMKINQWTENPMTIEVASTRQHISTLPIPTFTICGPVRPSVKEIKYLMNKQDVDGIYKIANILGMRRKAFDEMFNISTTRNGTYSNGKRFVISDLSLESFFRHISMYEYLNLRPAFDFGFDKRPAFMFRGLCLSSNIVPPSKIYKLNSVRSFLCNDFEPELRRRVKLSVTFQMDTESINGFPSFTGNWSSSNTNPILPPLMKLPILVYRSDINYLIGIFKSMSEGFKFIGRDNMLRYTIHNPWDVPSPFMRWHRIQPSKDSRILIEPELIVKYSVNDNGFLYKVPSAKQCYNATEKTLHFFQYYTQRNCLMECSTRRALRECGCVLFFMPHNESTYICSDENSSCAVNVAKDTHYDTGDRKLKDSCDCLPSCNYTDYKVLSFGLSPGKYNGSPQVDIVFRDDFFHPKVRTHTYNNNEMMDSTVFYLDAFLGVSIMTIAEIFYYMLLYAVDYLKGKIELMLEGLYM